MSKIAHGRVLNWKPDLPDHRDHRYVKVKPWYRRFPARVDLRAQCPPIVDQGQIGSCTANAIAGALGFLEIAKDPAFQFSSFEPFSRLFIYWRERVMEGDPMQDAGAMIRDGVASCFQKGACREKTWPYDANKLFTTPSQPCYAEAYGHKLTKYMRLNNLNLTELLDCLAAGFPFVFGISVFASFFMTGRDGMVPAPYGPLEGGHALLCVGYDLASQRFIVRNSWGTGWGDQGYCYIPFGYLTNMNLADDFWTLRR